MPTLPFLQNFEWAFVRIDPVNVPGRFEVRSFTCSWEIAIEVLGVANPQSWGRGGRRGSALVPFERVLVSSYKPSIVTFPLSLHVSEIFLLLCSSTPLFPTPPLVSPKFPHVPLGVGGWPLGYEERTCWANCPCSQFPRFPTYVVLIHQRHRQTDGRTDRRHAISIPRFALHCVSEKTRQVWNGIAQNCKDRFWWHLAKIFKIL